MFAYTFIQPNAVMIKRTDTMSTQTTVFTSRRTRNITSRTNSTGGEKQFVIGLMHETLPITLGDDPRVSHNAEMIE